MLQDARVASEPFWVQGGGRSCTEIPLQSLHGAPPARCFRCTHSCISHPSCPEDTALASPGEHMRSAPSAPSDVLDPLSTRHSSSQAQSCYSCSQSSQSQPKTRPELRTDTCLGLCLLFAGKAGCRPWEKVGLSLGKQLNASEGGNLEADLGFPFSFGILGATNTRKHYGIPYPGFSSSQLLVGSTGRAAPFPLLPVLALQGCQKLALPLPLRALL